MSLIVDVAVALGALVGAGVAIVGLGAWWRRHLAIEGIAIARRILLAAYAMRTAISKIRLSPRIFDPRKLPTLESRQALATYYSARFEPKIARLDKAERQLELAAQEAAVLWSIDPEDWIASLKKCARRLRFAFDTVLVTLQSQAAFDGIADEDLDRALAILWGQPRGDDYSDGVDASVEALEVKVHPRLRGGAWWRLRLWARRHLRPSKA